MHERGLADDELEVERERLGEARFARDERDAHDRPRGSPRRASREIPRSPRIGAGHLA